MAERGLGGEKHDRGFTLIELLVVLAVFSLIVVVLSGTVSFASRAWRTQERLVDRQGDYGSVENALRRLIASGRDFKGDPGSLAFVGALPRALGRPGQYDMQLKISDGRLVLAWRPHAPPASDGAGDVTETELSGSVADIHLEYYDAGTAQWTDNSADPGKPPALIRLAVQVVDDHRRSWPPFVVAPRIERPAAAK